ncbi:hypothetical protein GCM10009841_35720 [Microlunatus panaciterrae]|uniref:DNA ligase (ATP) n=1 Tax=Microlunatus panaciterrae TaxID=400768 RepID=A0ABS2RGU3_9ACTN|nr:non-homologous end-joining DNA ligase [Microlunatus panaciterrae]MBM7798230.1 DNA ligase D-like protein (predicted ligase) [Microlunatus panaciterrae]
MLADLADPADFGNEQDWAFEMKWDGVRVVAYLEGSSVELLSRSGLDITASYPEVADALQSIKVDSAVLDGEIVAVDRNGRPSFALLQSRINLTRPGDVQKARAAVPVQLMLFDLMELDGRSLIKAPYEQRHALLSELVATADHPRVQVPPQFEGDLVAALAVSEQLNLEGVVAKRLGSLYLPGGRGRTWLKIKHQRMQEVVIGGWRDGRGRRGGGIGSLLMAVPESGRLRYVGRVGTGFTDVDLDQIADRLEPLARATCPLVDVPSIDARDAHWVEPVLVGEVACSGWTRQRRIWQPTWRGWRPDKRPDDVRVEHPEDAPTPATNQLSRRAPDELR